MLKSNKGSTKKKRGRKPKSLQPKENPPEKPQPKNISNNESIPSKRIRRPVYKIGDDEWAELGDIEVKQEKDDDDYDMKLDASEEDEEEENEEDISDENGVENDTDEENIKVKIKKKIYKPTNRDFWTQKSKDEVREIMEEYGQMSIMERWMDGRKWVEIIKNRSQYEQYLPTNQGIRFRVKNARSSKKMSPYISIDLFQSDYNSGSYSVNVGGPIWSCDWCPQSCHHNNHHQFFALYTHNNTREEFLIESSSSSSCDKRIIQLWDFGLLKPTSDDNRGKNNKDFGGGSDGRGDGDGGKKSGGDGRMGDDNSRRGDGGPMVNLMVVEGGPVWCMQWAQGAWCCGGEEEEDDDEKKDDFFEKRRMGLLATACHDGLVRIYSVPGIKRKKLNNNNDNNNYNNNNKNINSVFKAQPVAKLFTNLLSACKCVAWNVTKEYVLVAAGYVDGTLALWSLTTKSSLLLRNNNSNNNNNNNKNNNEISERIQAYRVVKAHLGVLSGLTFNHGDLLVTVSLDRSIKFWNISPPTTKKGASKTSRLSHIHTPVFHMKTTRNTCVLWPPLEKFRVFVGSDESFNYKRNSCLGYYFFDKRVSTMGQATHYSTIWDMDYPYDNDVIVTCDNSGGVQTCRLTSRKIKTNREMKSFVSILKMDDNNNNDDNDNDNVNNNICTCNKIGISCCCYKSFTYHDHLMKGFLRQDDIVCDDIVKNVTCAIHKVSFNKNKGHTNWLFFGGMNGILRGVHLSML